jgi:hypothetical protein
MGNELLKLLAVFIFREVERKALGVGMGVDMLLIHDGGQPSREGIGWDNVDAMKDDIPPLSESLYTSWGQASALGKWLKRYFYT